MTTYKHPLFAHFYDRLAKHSEESGMRELRKQLLLPLIGDVLEIGAGTGANLEFYTNCSKLFLLEPNPHMRRRLEQKLHKQSGLPEATILDSAAENLQLSDNTLDAVVSTLTLCSVANPVRVLEECHRVLKANGCLVLIEHIRGVGLCAFIQEALTPLQIRIAGGCHLNRQTLDTLGKAGFDTSTLEKATLPGSSRLASGTFGVAYKKSTC